MKFEQKLDYLGHVSSKPVPATWMAASPAGDKLPTDLAVLGVVPLQPPAITSGYLAGSPGESGITSAFCCVRPSVASPCTFWSLAANFIIAASRLKRRSGSAI